MNAENYAPQCVGVCIIDPDTGACLGCGRSAEESAGVPQPRAPAPAAKPAPLPANVAAEVGAGSE